MIEATAPHKQTERVTCSIPGPRNDLGKAKLLATIVPAGLLVWCRCCQTAHLIERERVIAAWERGESVQCEVKQGSVEVL